MSNFLNFHMLPTCCWQAVVCFYLSTSIKNGGTIDVCLLPKLPYNQ